MQNFLAILVHARLCSVSQCKNFFCSKDNHVFKKIEGSPNKIIIWALISALHFLFHIFLLSRKQIHPMMIIGKLCFVSACWAICSVAVRVGTFLAEGFCDRWIGRGLPVLFVLSSCRPEIEPSLHAVIPRAVC